VTPLHLNQGVETCRLLLDSKADVAAKDKRYGHDVFFLFMRRSVTAAHSFPLFVYKSPSPSQQTALHRYLEFQASMFLSRRRDDLSAIFETCRLLLDSKADVAAKDSRFCRRSWFLLFAVTLSFCDPNCLWFYRGQTPLHCSAQVINFETCRLLLDSKADINAEDEE
jgi:ankyrin repeat protein